MFDKRNALLVTGFVVGILIIGIWVVQINGGRLPYIDQWTKGFVPGLQDTHLFDFFRAITNLGSRAFMFPFVLTMTIVLLLSLKDWLPPLVFGGGTLGAHLLNQLIKWLIKRERPTIWVEANAEGFSFPSGHSMITMVCYGVLGYYVSKKITSNKIRLVVRGGVAVLIFLIGLSRYVINVHYLTDIIAGFTIGLACLMLLIALDKWVRAKRTLS